jgi:hypothetical protein
MPRPKLDKYVCDVCNMAFATPQMKYYHKNNTCTGEKSLVDELNEMRIRYSELQKQFDLFKESSNVVNNYFNINYFSYAKTNYIDFERIINTVEQNNWNQIHVDAIKQAYFNTDHVKNMSVCIADTDKVIGYGFIYLKRFNAWIRHDMKELILVLQKNGCELIEDFVNGVSETSQFWERQVNGFNSFKRYCDSDAACIDRMYAMLCDSKVDCDRYCRLQKDQYVNGEFVQALRTYKHI